MVIQHKKTIYKKISTRKALRILPMRIKNENFEECRIIQCEFSENNKPEIEKISFDHICIVPVTEKSSQNFIIERGLYYTVTLDENYKEIAREEPVSSVKLYVDSVTMHEILVVFGKK